MPRGEEGAPFPPRQRKTQLVVVEFAHGLAEPVGSEEGLGREADRYEAQTEDDEIQGDQGPQDNVVLSCRRGEEGVSEIALQVVGKG